MDAGCVDGKKGTVPCYSRVNSFVVSILDDAMIGVIVWLAALVGYPDESKT